ncbi:XylF ABC-type xylose transport system, periplasmic component [Candidatus Nanopelagicaceae bacterium]
MIKKLTTVVAATAMAVTGLMVAAPAQAADKGLIGVAMPTQSSTRWISDGKSIKAALEKDGYSVDLQYAEDDIPTQVSQLEAMLTKGAKALIIASIDGEQLTDVLAKAKSKNVPVIAYDRLIRKSANVDYYATFDNFKVGVQQATSLLVGLGVFKSEASTKADGPKAKGPFNVELFAGSPDDNNATFFFNGAMSVLNPLIKSKVIVVKSGQTAFTKVATLRWDGAVAQKRMEDILVSSYAKAKVNGVLSPYDGLSRGIIAALTDGGYTTKTMPIITGQDAEVLSVKAMIKGDQYSTIFKDTRELAKVAVSMAEALLAGKKPTVNDTKTYNNGVKVVPSFLLTPYIVTTKNYKKVLIDSGYIKASDLG